MRKSFSDRISIAENKSNNKKLQNSQKENEYFKRKIKLTSNKCTYNNSYINRLVNTQIQPNTINKSILKRTNIQNYTQLKKNKIHPQFAQNYIQKTHQIHNKFQQIHNFKKQSPSQQMESQSFQKKINFQNFLIQDNQKSIFQDKFIKPDHLLRQIHNLRTDKLTSTQTKDNQLKETNFKSRHPKTIIKQNQAQLQIISRFNKRQSNISIKNCKSQPKTITKNEQGASYLINLVKKHHKLSQQKTNIKKDCSSLNKNQNIPYKKFDITKLDFSFNIRNSNQQEGQSRRNLNNYCSIVQRSKNNINKIIQLNKLIKEKQSTKYQNFLEEQKQNSVQILYRLKKGCFGTVYQGKIKQTGKLIAIKTIVQDKKYYQRQQQICKFINNPFLVKIHLIFHSSQQPHQKIINLQNSNSIQNHNSKFYNNPLKQKSTIKKIVQNKAINKMTNIPIEEDKPLKHHFIMRNKKISFNSITQFQDNDVNADKSLQNCNNSNSITKLPLRQNHLPQNNNFIINAEAQETSNNGVFSKRLNQQGIKNQNKGAQPPFKKITNIVMDLYDCDLHDYIEMKNKIDPLTLKIFSYQMVRSLLYLHSNQICHRDIKPHNFLVKRHIVVLSDFGSAKIMKNHKNSNVSYICSRYYRAPQLVLGYKYYDKSIDIWALGCTLAQLALGKPIFPGLSSIDQLIKIIRILGQPNWRKISFMIEAIPKIPQIQAKGLRNIFPSQISPLFLDLLQSLLVFNPLHRISAGQALCHPYFDELRQQTNFKQICKQMDISHFLTFNRDQLKKSEHLKNKLIPLWSVQTKVSQKNQQIQQLNFENV